MSGGWSLLRRASGRMLRSGALAVMLTISIALLAGLVTTGPLFGRATATGSLERKLDTVVSNSQLIQQAALGVVIQGQASTGTWDQVAATVDAAPWLGAPVTTQYAAAFSWFGPQSDLGPGTVRATVLAAVLVAALALLCNALVILLQARSIGRELDGSATPGVRGPWLPLLTGATVLAVGAAFARNTHASYTDPMSAVLPILLSAGAAAAITLLAVLVAARRSATLKPAEVLRDDQ